MGKVAGWSTLAWAVLAYGAQAQVIPPAASPGRIPERFAPTPSPQSKPEIIVPGPEVLAPPEQAGRTRFVLSAIAIDGATAIPPSQLQPLYAGLLGQEVSLLDVFRVRDAITAKYRASGYILSQAIVPAQKIEGGIVHIQVVEGRIANVILNDAAHDRRGLIKAMAEKVMASRPLKASVLERYVLLIGDLPGVTVSTTLKPSANESGAADLIVTVTRHQLSGSAEIDNSGSVAIGPEEGTLGINLNSVLGLEEQTSLLGALTGQTRELHYLSLRHAEVLNDEGWLLTTVGSYSDSRPGGAISALDARGFSTNASLFMTDPVIRSRSETLKLGLGFTYENSSTDLLGVRFSQDKVRFLTANISLDQADELLGPSAPAQNLIQAEVDQGLDVLDATKTGSVGLSRANGHSDFTLVAASLTRVQSIRPRWSIAFGLAGQYAFDPLLVSQQFGLGGKRFGRGYEPSELTGDSGAAFSVEPRYDPPIQAKWFDSPQLYTFYEVGEVWQKSPLTGQAPHQSLASAGVGFRVLLMDRFNANFELAKPLTRSIASRGDKDVRPLFDISLAF